METVLTLTEVALKSLTVSPLNVRKTNLDEDIKALAADIDAHGLKQNLVVVPSLVDGRYEVVAGGRRLHALMHLVDEGRLPFDAPIPVRVEARDEGRPTSLSENLHRVAMNPADEFIAYRTIVEEHADEPDPVAYCSRRFGVSRAHVEGRLRLASLAPDILDAMRDGKLNVESAKAYASLADHKLQITVFTAEEKKTWGVKHEPRSVRDALKLKTLSVACAQAVYVGIEVYRQAGGRIELEMFLGSEGGERIVDPSLLDKLAREKIAAELPKLAKKDGFASALPAAGFGQYPAWPKAPAGMERAYDYGLDRTALPKELKKESTAVYRLADDGSGLILYGRFKPSAAATPEPKRDYQAEYRARERQNRIDTRAAVLSLPDLSGTPLDGLIVTDDDDYVTCDDDDDTVFWLNVRVKVTADQLAAHRAEAEAIVAREDAEEAAEEADANDHVAAAEGADDQAEAA